jgi:hypothetical protein
LELGFITKEQAITMMDHLYDNHITENGPDEVALGAIHQVVDWLREHPGV